MKPASFIAFSLALVLAAPLRLGAQYSEERVLEKSFEQTTFFFVPSNLSPYGIGSFGSSAPGLLRDPLLDITINPAKLALDSAASTYLYTDYRSASNVKEHETGYSPPWLYENLRVPASLLYYPRVYLNIRRELEPVFSGAFICRPLPSAAEELYLGATYQLVTQDEKYYNIPQDIYRSVAGYDYAGRTAAAANSLPIVDKYSGEDNIHQTGHFISGFARFSPAPALAFGVKLSRVMFKREGALGATNLWDFSWTSTSIYSNRESRSQSYAHWDLSGGLEYRPTAQVTVGATGGYLWGDASQALRTTDSSYYSSASANQNPPSSWSSYYIQSGNTLELWRHAGKTVYGGIDLIAQLTPATTLSVFYQHQRAKVTIGLGSTTLDTSYSTYSWSSNASGNASTSQSYLTDVRAGGGSQTVSTDRIMGSLQWKVSPKVNVSLGALVEWESTDISTSEDVAAVSRSAYWSTNDPSSYYSSAYGQDESKNLLWTFTARRTSFQVPVFLTVQATDALEVLVGVNRNMAHWKIDDVTLAMFRYRTEASNGTVQRMENFGERYTEPAENVSDIRTTFIAGLTAAPSRNVKIRLLMVPNFTDTIDGSELEQLQWWIGVTLTP